MARAPHWFLMSSIGVLLCAGVVLAAEPGGEKDTVAVSSLGKASAGIETVVLKPTVLPNLITVPGKIEAIPTMQFDQHAPLSGRIAKVEVKPGDTVVAGQTLAIVESSEMNQLAAQFLQSRLEVLTDFAAQRTQMDSQVTQAEQQLKLCEENLRRIRRLYEDKISARKDVAQAETDFELAKTKYTSAVTNRDIMLKTLKARVDLIQNPIRQRLQIIGVDQKRIEQMLSQQNTLTTVPIVAARGGIITGLAATPGMSIDPSTNLFTITDLSKVWATANVYENDMSRMKLGERVTVRVHAVAGPPVSGELTYIGNQVDSVTRTLPVRAELENAERKLKPDMYADLSIQTAESASVIAVPKDALVSAAPAGQAVFVQEGDNFREQRITIGRTVGDLIEIVSGLQAGDRLVVHGAFQLHAQLLKDQGNEDLFVSPTEGERMEDHAVDNKTGAVHMNLQTVLLIVAAAFVLGFALSALFLFRGRGGSGEHECSADLEAHDHDATPAAPTALPVIPLDSGVAAAKKKSEG